MDARPVDPRDQVSETADPAYRVHFWDGNVQDEWELTGADVPEVLQWAHERADGRTFVVWACIPDQRQNGVHLIRLAGWEGPAVGPRPAHAHERR